MNEMPKFAANLSMMFNEHTFLERFQAAADVGFKAVEYLFPYDFPAEEVKAVLDNAGLKQALFNIVPGDWAAGERGLASLPERRADFIAAVDKSIYYAKVIRTPLLHLMSGIAPHDDPSAIASYRESLKIAADKAGEAGITVVIEPINKRDMPGYFLNDFNRALDFISELNQPNVKLQFDVYHRQILHGDVVMALREVMPVIGHIQIASVPLRNEPNTGELNDSRIFTEIDALGYQGYIGCEYRPAAGTTDGLDWLKPYAS
jgi:hydroxypyruvate isomerase